MHVSKTFLRWVRMLASCVCRQDQVCHILSDALSLSLCLERIVSVLHPFYRGHSVFVGMYEMKTYQG